MCQFATFLTTFKSLMDQIHLSGFKLPCKHPRVYLLWHHDLGNLLMCEVICSLFSAQFLFLREHVYVNSGLQVHKVAALLSGSGSNTQESCGPLRIKLHYRKTCLYLGFGDGRYA